MTLDYYRIFYYVARYKSFSNAAEMLGSNQPNITRCMNILENEWYIQRSMHTTLYSSIKEVYKA